MVFSSLTFLYGFLPLALLLYFPVKNRVYRNAVLLIFSLVFYSWGEPKYILDMLLASGAAYCGGLLIDRFRESPRRKKAVFLATVLLLVGNLFFFKYLNFVADNLSLLLSRELPIPKILLPIGISFYTFQILSYVIDLYRGEIQVQRNYFYLTLYVSFFPQLIAGPIVRYQTIEKEILERRETWEGVVSGLKRFIIGLGKKVILADNIALIAVTVYEGDTALYGTSLYWLAAFSYALQIYFDFSGYSDMAIGLGRIFGFHFLENFEYPYTALSITDFWRKWHISLSSWFRDYIYIPLGGNRVGKWKWVRNILAVWALTGLWHGAQWNFVLWGLYYGCLLLLEKLVLQKALDKLPRVVRWAYSFFFILLGWVLFNLTDFQQMLHALRVMFLPQATQWLEILKTDSAIVTPMLYLPFGLLGMFPIGKRVKNCRWKDTAAFGVLSNLGYAAALAVSLVTIISSSYDFFIYFRF